MLESFLGIVATIVKSSFVFESLGKDVVSEAAAVFSQGPAHLQRRPSVSRYLHTPTPSDRWCSGLPGWGACCGGWWLRWLGVVGCSSQQMETFREMGVMEEDNEAEEEEEEEEDED